MAGINFDPYDTSNGISGPDVPNADGSGGFPGFPAGGPKITTNDPPYSAPTSSTDPYASLPSSYSTVKGYYETLLNRDPENTDVVANWLNGTHGDLSALYAGIANSPEAKAYAASRVAGGSPTTPSGAAPSGDWIGAALSQAQSTDDPEYWRRVIAADPKAAAGDPSAIAYWQGRIAQGDGALAVRNGTVQKFQDGGPNPGGYTDPSSMLYLNQVMKRLQQVQQPQDNSIFDLLKSLGLSQANKLQQAPYTPADDAALITQYRQPLTQARDTAKQQAAADLSRRGFTPTSGVYQDRMKAIDQAYEHGVAQGANQMGVNAVALKNSNALQAMQILSSLSSANNTQIDRSNAMSDQAVNLAKMFPDFDAQRLSQLLSAGSDTSGSSALSSLMGLGNLNLNTAGMNNANDAANSAAWGKLLAALFGSL